MKNIWWKKEHCLDTSTMHNGIFEGCKVSDVPTDYLEFIVACSKDGSNNVNTILANKHLKLKDYDSILYKAIDYKAKMILKEYTYQKKLLESNTFYFNCEKKYAIYTKAGRLNKSAISNIEVYANDPDFDEKLGIENFKVDIIKRVIKYGLRARVMTLNTIVARNILNEVNGNQERYQLIELDYHKIFDILSSGEYESYMRNFYMRYKDKIENNVEYEF